MKISLLLASFAAGKKPFKEQITESENYRNATVSCGELFLKQRESRIQSPGYPGQYSNDLRCFWTVENECAANFTITAFAFDLEYHPQCHYDKLTFGTVRGDTVVFCGNEDRNPSDYSSYSSSSYDYEENASYEIEGMSDSFTIEGSKIELKFSTDDSVIAPGFDIQITANYVNESCVPGLLPSRYSCLDYPESGVGSVFTAYYQTLPGADIAVPFSDFSSDDLGAMTRPDCVRKCMATAGCFKVKAWWGLSCELYGNKLSPIAETTPIRHQTWAITGKRCHGDDRVWIDGRTTTRIYCLFSVPEGAERFLEDLNRQNPEMLEWVSSDSETVIDQVATSQIWSFAVAEDRSSNFGVWYVFNSVTFYRQFFLDDSRARRDVDDLFEVLAGELAAEFVSALDIGDAGAEVLETEDPVIEVEILEPVAQPPAVEFAAAFDAFEEIIHDAVMALPKWNNVKMLEWMRKRFGWFTDFSDAPCARYAGAGVGAGVDYVTPNIDAADPCATIASFHGALLGYFDDFVCFDRADENPFGKKRMETRTKHLLNRSKVHFNRFLKKLSCQLRI